MSVWFSVYSSAQVTQLAFHAQNKGTELLVLHLFLNSKCNFHFMLGFFILC